MLLGTHQIGRSLQNRVEDIHSAKRCNVHWRQQMNVYALIVLILGFVPHVLASVVYNVTDLTGTANGVPAGVLVIGSAINDTGQIAGYVSFFRVGSMESTAMLYTAGDVTLINPPGVIYSRATGINNFGDAVGYGQGGAFRYSNGQSTFLGLLGSQATFASAGLTGINNRGEAVGCRTVSVGNATGCRALILKDGQVQELGTLGGLFSSASSINGTGQITGTSLNAEGKSDAFLYQNGTMTDLGDLAGLGSTGTAINDRGQIVGTSPVPGYLNHAFLYDNGAMKDLGTLTGETSQAYSINNKAQIVGEDSAGAFLYEDGRLVDLNSLIDPSLGIDLFSADAINDAGVIVARGTSNATGRYLAGFVLTPAETAPVPEPRSFAITAAGGLCISVLLILCRSREHD